MNYADQKLQFAQLKVASQSVWESVYGDQGKQIEESYPALHQEGVEAYADLCGLIERKKVELALHPDSDVLSVTFSGCDMEVDHYDIDEAIDQEFGRGNGVSTDSESGCFFCYAHPSRVQELHDFLTLNFTTLDFSMTDDLSTSVRELEAGNKNFYSCLTVPGCTSWSAAAEFVEANS